MNNKKVLIAWSGGLDSTYLIQEYLEKGYEVEVINCNFRNGGPQQMKREQAAMKKMMKGYFRNKAVTLIGTSHIAFDGYCFGSLNLSQVPVWLFNLISYLRGGHTEVAIGYVMNDDAVSFLDTIKGIWNSYADICSVPLPPLVFPLVKKKKWSIWCDLHDDLRKHVTWCESPEKASPCGNCPSCKRMIDIGAQLPLVVEKLNTVEEPTLVEEETRC